MTSAVVLTKNEENNIIDCLESLSWCDEIIVVDDFSQDRTIEIINSLKNKKIAVFRHALNENYSKQRNFGLSKAKYEWILFVDADERIPLSLRDEILKATSRRDNYDGYFIKRKDFIWGKELRYGETGNIKLLRLVKKGKGEWSGHVHERWETEGAVGQLNFSLMHYPHQTITEFLREINFYTEIKAKELFDSGIKTSWLSIILYPKAKFILNYFLRLGFLDGIQGLIVAIFMSFHSFLVRSKLWKLRQEK
ncbi:MAG: glycosyltransferase family 2 protein [Candidatus Levybacteria bacterium]|nr:glycosyltransferase family 2 protein [Candidatus Levybacteria bacterium]